MTTPILYDPNAVTEVKDWGPIPTMIEGHSVTSGGCTRVERRERAASGCTPVTGTAVTRDEFCHFLLGRCTYTHESGEVIEIKQDTIAFFPQGWKGTCRVHETIRKVYMIR